MWSPKGQQVMIPTPGQRNTHYGIGAVNYHTGETLVLVRRHKRRREIAELLQALVDKHPHETVYVTWDNASTHEDDEIEEVVRGAAGRLVPLYLPTYSPWLNPAEMLWRHFRREVTHCELFETMKAVIDARHTHSNGNAQLSRPRHLLNSRTAPGPGQYPICGPMPRRLLIP
jgi:putative transposase